VRPYTVDDAVVDPALRAFVLSEMAQALGGVLDALPCSWVNPRSADEAAHHKPLQWAVAEQVGLKVPRTLVTTRPEAARAFVEGIGVGRVVFKAFLAMADAWRETRVVTQEDLGRLDLVRYAPVIFQEYVEGVDLRITVVGDRVFAAEIDARGTAYPFDMRVVVGESKVRPVELPPDVHAGLLRLQRRLGLVYGAIDMRRTTGGEYLFFEVNPAGQWLFVEQRTGLPISRAVAEHLARLDAEPPKGPTPR
jgi:glutathione synthase/RimK-type ligase-like ATP-grasp enzyme